VFIGPETDLGILLTTRLLQHKIVLNVSVMARYVEAKAATGEDPPHKFA